MPITLNQKNQIKNQIRPKIQSATSSHLRRANRVRTDLTKVYTEAEVKSRAKYLGMKYIDLYGFPIDTNHLITVKQADAENMKMGVFSIRNKNIDLASPLPGHAGQAEFLQNLQNQGFEPIVYLCSDLSFERLISRYNFVVEVKKITDDINLSQQNLDSFAKNNLSLAEMEKKLQSVSTSEAVEMILSAALQNKASDIHFEPEKESYVLRLRLDGVLHTFATLPKASQRGIENRLKLISGVKINIDNIPQDGRFSFFAGDREIDVRVSMLPSNYGYSVVMRLLGTGQIALELDSLGFTGIAKDRVATAVQRPQGMILTTGPTGSGKTTTLYTFLESLNNGQSKIISLEDPIEYKLPGISQTQIDSSGGYTFADGLRSILRQDPDVVMVGEIRDGKTAEVAVQASMTGHLVLSTIHTNDAAGAVPRMMELNVKGFLLADSLSVIIGQRLVRKLCPHCTVGYQPTPQEEELVMSQISQLPDSEKKRIPQPLRFYTAHGCKECNGLGYKGRVGVYEVLSMTNGLRELVNNTSPSITQVRQVAQSEGMVTMFQDGLIKASQGMTDLAELMRVVANT